MTLTHPPGYSPVSLSALAHLEAWQNYAPYWPRELNRSQVETWQRKDRTVMFLHTRYKFLSLLPSFACFVFPHLPFSGYPGSVKGESAEDTARVSSDHLPSRWAGEWSSGTKHIVVLWAIFLFHCWLCTKEEYLQCPLHFLIKIIITWVCFFFKIREKNLQRPVWMWLSAEPFSLKHWRICQSSYWERRADEPKD